MKITEEILEGNNVDLVLRNEILNSKVDEHVYHVETLDIYQKLKDALQTLLKTKFSDFNFKERHYQISTIIDLTSEEKKYQILYFLKVLPKQYEIKLAVYNEDEFLSGKQIAAKELLTQELVDKSIKEISEWLDSLNL